MRERCITILVLAALLLPMVAGVQPIRAADDPIINEFVFNHTGTDTEAFIEVFGDPSTDYSGFTLLEIEGDEDGAGTIDAAITVGTTDAGGFWIDDEDVENGTVTLLLVEGFTGSGGDDLDADDDGVLDSTPWTRIVDDVAVHDGDENDHTYATTALTPDYDGGIYTVGGASRIPNGTDTDSVGDWVRNDFDGAGFAGFTGTPEPGEALNTPGATNELVSDEPVVPDASISEIRIDQPGEDYDEYFELMGPAETSLDSLTYLIIGDGTGGSGVIESVTDLSGESIGSSGYFVAAEDTFTLGTAGLTTDLNFENSDNVTHLLVSSFTGANGDDLDTDDDGVLDITPWTELVDCVALVEDPSGGDLLYCDTTVGPDGSYVPGHVYLCPEGWQIGAFDPSGGDDTPGAANPCAPAVPEASISEIRIDQPDTDDDEYFELVGTADTMLDGLTHLVIGDGTGGSGVIENVTDLSGQSIGSGGYFVAAEDTFTLGTADLTTDLNFENSDNVTHLLVSDFTGSNGDDLDTDDDGTLDSTPWTEIVDCVGLVQTFDGGDLLYCDTTVGPDGSYVPGHVYLCDDGWRIGEFALGITDSPGAENPCDVVFTGECGDPATLVSEVQGDGLTSPMEGDQVVVEAIVAGDFQWGGDDDGDLGGFYVQEETSDEDSDPMTSEGVFVYDSGFGVDVAVGDRVRINGIVSEYYDLTQIGSLSEVIVCDYGSVDRITPASISLPVTNIDDLEAYEGMSVVISQPLYISEYYNFDRYGEIVLTTDRQFQPTAIYHPDSPEAEALAETNQLNRIQLDDGRTEQNPDPARHPNGSEFDLNNRFRGGDIVQNVVGMLGYGFGEYEIHPTIGADYAPTNLRPTAPSDVGGNIKAASFNVLNYFTTLDTGDWICGPTGGQECRGADNLAEFTRQQTKIVAAMCAIDADIFGLMELENTNPDNDPDPGDGISNYVLKSLVDALNDPDSPCPDKTYTFTDSEATGTDAIQQGIIYKANTVTPLGRAVLDDLAFTDPNDLGEQKNRPAIAETFVDNETDGVFTAVVNHLKSKGSECGEGDDHPYAGNCDLTRTLAAQALGDWLDTDPTGSGDPDFLVLGDLNAYDKEDPINVLKANGYTDLLYEYAGEYPYSYVFDGQLGYLDYAMPNENLLGEVNGVTVWHINADEPDILDYDTTYKKDAQDALYEPNAYRASDHDPVIVGLTLTPFDYQLYMPLIAQSYSD